MPDSNSKRKIQNSKLTFLLLFPAIASGLFFFSCNNDTTSKTESAAAPKPDTVRVELVPVKGAAPFTVTEGTVFWQGKKALGDPHNGTIKVSGGELMVNQGRLLGGKVTLDMASIAVTNLNDGGEKRDLESHLKDRDFFEVKKFPTAEFVITEVLPSNLPAFNWVVRGDLTIKGKTNPVNIPVKMTIEGDKLDAASATFPINRTHWGISFRSGALGTAKDKVVEDVVPLSLVLRAKRR